MGIQLLFAGRFAAQMLIASAGGILWMRTIPTALAQMRLSVNAACTFKCTGILPRIAQKHSRCACFQGTCQDFHFGAVPDGACSRTVPHTGRPHAIRGSGGGRGSCAGYLQREWLCLVVVVSVGVCERVSDS